MQISYAIAIEASKKKKKKVHHILCESTVVSKDTSEIIYNLKLDNFSCVCCAHSTGCVNVCAYNGPIE